MSFQDAGPASTQHPPDGAALLLTTEAARLRGHPSPLQQPAGPPANLLTSTLSTCSEPVICLLLPASPLDTAFWFLTRLSAVPHALAGNLPPASLVIISHYKWGAPQFEFPFARRLLGSLKQQEKPPMASLHSQPPLPIPSLSSPP